MINDGTRMEYNAVDRIRRRERVHNGPRESEMVGLFPICENSRETYEYCNPNASDIFAHRQLALPWSNHAFRCTSSVPSRPEEAGLWVSTEKASIRSRDFKSTIEIQPNGITQVCRIQWHHRAPKNHNTRTLQSTSRPIREISIEPSVQSRTIALVLWYLAVMI